MKPKHEKRRMSPNLPSSLLTLFLNLIWSVHRTGSARTSPTGRALCTHPEARAMPSVGP